MNPMLREFTFENLATTNKIVVTTNLNQQLKTLEQPEVIRTLLALIQKDCREGWRMPEMGVPIAKLRLNFYQGDQPLGNLGIGQTFLSAHQLGTFWSRTADETLRAQLLEIIGLEG